jgi:PIN domain nuclease of toxin-antitoxin system
MRLLLDTHPLLWFALNDPSLSGTAMGLILDPAHEKFVSPASYWEIAIKISVGKYSLAVPYEDFFRGAIDDNGFRILPIEPRHTAK